MRSSGDGGNARDGLLAVGSIQGGDEDHMDDIEEEEKAQGCGERNNSRVSDFNLAEINFCLSRDI